LEAEPLAADIGVAKASKSGERKSGDSGAFFKTEEGYLYVLLSDGMGAGSNAAKSSGEAIRILERFLRAGVSPESAVRLLNDIMLLRNDEDTVSATVDLAQVNLFTGEVVLLKYGSAPTYVKAERSVRRVRSATFAAGLTPVNDHEPDKCRFILKAGHTAVIVTDGVLEDGDDTDLTSCLTAFPMSGDPSDLAREIVERAKKRGSDDDITAIAIKIDVRR